MRVSRVWTGAVVMAVMGSAARAEPQQGALASLWAEVERAWEAGPGRAANAQVSTERRAREREPGLFESLSVEFAPEVSPGDTLRSEVAGSIGVGVRILGVGHRKTEAAARLSLAQADLTSRRVAFAEEVVARYGEWVAAELQARHLREHIDELEADLAPLREAVAQRKLDALTLDGLEVELVRLGLELERAKTAVVDAASALSLALGQSVDPTTFGALPTEPIPAVWHEIAPAAHPELARLTAEASRERAAAAVVRRSDDPLLSLAATVRHVDEPDGPFVYGGVTAGLTVPLSRVGGAEAERHAGRAVALGFERDHKAVLFELELARRQRRHERWVTELERLRSQAAPRLEARVERTAAAVRAGRAAAAELVLARRDRIELHHAEVALVGQLVASGLMSTFWKTALEAREEGR